MNKIQDSIAKGPLDIEIGYDGPPPGPVGGPLSKKPEEQKWYKFFELCKDAPMMTWFHFEFGPSDENKKDAQRAQSLMTDAGRRYGFTYRTTCQRVNGQWRVYVIKLERVPIVSNKSHKKRS